MKKKGESLAKKMKRSLNERHKETKRAHGNLTDMFWHSQRSFSIRKEIEKDMSRHADIAQADRSR